MIIWQNFIVEFVFESVRQIGCLGIIIEKTEKEYQEIQEKIAKGNQKYGMLQSLMVSKYQKRKKNLQICEII